MHTNWRLIAYMVTGHKYRTIESFHDAVRTPCALRADAMLDIFFCVARYWKNPKKK